MKRHKAYCQHYNFYLISVPLLILLSFISSVSLVDIQLKTHLRWSVTDIASELTSKAKSSNEMNNFICETWIFTSLYKSSNDENYFANYFYRNENPLGEIVPLIPIVFISLNSTAIKHSSNFSYKNYEFQDEDIIHSTAFGLAQLATNCVSVFIDLRKQQYVQSRHNLNEIEEFIQKRLIKTKIARPHKDYFIFLDESQSQSQMYHEEEQLVLSSEVISEFRYKYYVTISEGSANTSDLNIFNACDPKGNRNSALALFSRKCDSVISHRHYRVTCTNIPSMIRPDTSDNGLALPSGGGGFLYSMLSETAIHHNFTFNVKLASFNGATGFKKQLEPGKDPVWVGAMGELFNGEADLSFGAGTTYDRHRIVDPAVLHTWFTRVIYIKPPPLRSSSWSILWPLEPMVWIVLIGVIIFVMIPVFYVSAHLDFKMHSSLYNFRRSSLFLEIIDAILRIFMEQAATLRHWTSARLRLLIFLCTVTALVLETGYRCKLMTFLSFMARESYPKTHRELSTSNYALNFRYYGGAAYKDYKASTDPMHARFLDKAILVNSSIECLEAVLMMSSSSTESYACMDFVLNGDFTITKNFTLPGIGAAENTLFIKSVDTDLRYAVSWAMRKGSPWRESFDRILLQFYSAGLYDYWIEDDWVKTRKGGIKWWKSIINGPGNHNGSHTTETSNQKELLLYAKIQELLIELRNKGPRALRLNNFTGILLICIIGLIMGIICFMAEFIQIIGCWGIFQRGRKKNLNSSTVLEHNLFS